MRRERGQTRGSFTKSSASVMSSGFLTLAGAAGLPFLLRTDGWMTKKEKKNFLIKKKAVGRVGYRIRTFHSASFLYFRHSYLHYIFKTRSNLAFICLRSANIQQLHALTVLGFTLHTHYLSRHFLGRGRSFSWRHCCRRGFWGTRVLHLTSSRLSSGQLHFLGTLLNL